MSLLDIKIMMYTKEYSKEYHRQYWKANKARLIQFSNNHNKKVRKAIIDLLGDKCSNLACPIPKRKMNPKCLHIDHINGGGKNELRNRFNHNVYNMYAYYIAHPEEAKQKLQILCVYCNWLKRYQVLEYTNL